MSFSGKQENSKYIRREADNTSDSSNVFKKDNNAMKK